MWHVEGFDAKEDATDLAAWLRDHLLPHFRAQGFTVRVFMTQAALGPRPIWLATAGFGDIDGWAARAGDEGAALITELLAQTTRMQGGIVTEL
jgi:hypothetical protein